MKFCTGYCAICAQNAAVCLFAMTGHVAAPHADLL
eukprot:COSAG01_NODE_34242_length_551_cov_0.550885_1_plen_34_part_10